MDIYLVDANDQGGGRGYLAEYEYAVFRSDDVMVSKIFSDENAALFYLHNLLEMFTGIDPNSVYIGKRLVTSWDFGERKEVDH